MDQYYMQASIALEILCECLHKLRISSLFQPHAYGGIPPQPLPGAIHMPAPPGQFIAYHAAPPPPPHAMMVPMHMPAYSYPPAPHPGALPPGPPPPGPGGPGQPMAPPYGIYTMPDYPPQGTCRYIKFYDVLIQY